MSAAQHHAVPDVRTSRPKIVLVLGVDPHVDIAGVTAQAVEEGRALLLITLGRELTPAQDAVIGAVARLSWSWFDALSWSAAGSDAVLEDDDHVILAVSERERALADAALDSMRGHAP